MKIITRKEIFTTKWLCLRNTTYFDKNNNEQEWNYVCRNHFHGVVTLICKSRQYGHILFISQPRVAIEKNEISFPAGLIDRGESPAQAALRELKEETGYTGDIEEINGPFPKSAGLSNETTFWVKLLVDEKNVSSTQMEDSEDIQFFWKTPRQMLKWITTLDSNKYAVAADVWFFLKGTLWK
ncbi:NUDIX domain-containing protein [Candidatus Harpocratesius sp.]